MGDTSGFALLVVLFITVAVLYSVINSRRNAAKLRRKIEESWGTVPKPKKNPSQCANFFLKHKEERNNAHFIDDITWNDLDMDRVFSRLNSSWSTAGEECLYSLLREPVFDENTLKERDRLISFFSDNSKARRELQFQLSRLGRIESVDIPFYLYNDEKWQSRRAIYYRILAVIPILSIIGMIISFPVGIAVFLLSMAVNMTVYYKAKNEIAPHLEALGYIVGLISSASRSAALNIPELGEYNHKLREAVRNVKGINKKSFLVLYKTNDAILEYVKLLLLSELIAFESMFALMSRYRQDLIQIYETLGFLESMISIASYRKSISYYTTPVLHTYNKNNGLQLRFRDICHPLINDPVANSISAVKPVLITGSNASGKSTFLKTTAINAIFAQTIYTCLAKEYVSDYFMIFTSMALKDSLVNNESYYITEIKSLKRIIDRLNSTVPCLCFIDEVLRGTNTIERIAASSQVLHYLSLSNCLCFAATHDIELTTILEGYFENYHFQESFDDREITFDYSIYAGRSNTRNAIKLLKFMGYQDSIVQKAEDHANSFLTSGSWQKVD